MTVMMGIDARLRLARLLLTVPGSFDDDALAAQLFAAGVDGIGVRRSGSRAQRLATLDRLRSVESGPGGANDRQGLIVVHDDVDLAVEWGADVVQLAADAGLAAPVRARLHRWARIGRRCHTTSQIDAAMADDDVHYLLVDVDTVPHLVRASASNDGPSHDGLSNDASSTTAKPWFATGGIDAERLPELVRAGVGRVQVGSAVLAADQPVEIARAMAEQLRRAAPIWGALT